MEEVTKMKFCFFGDISDALMGKTPGGGELQVALLAKALALKGHDVVIVNPSATESFVTAEGVRLINIPDWNKGFRGFRLFKYRIPALKKVLTEEKADYYYVRMRSYMHLIPYLVSKKLKSKFIVAIACDLDTLSFWEKFKHEYIPKFNLIQFLTLSVPNDFVFNYLLRKSDHITIQHRGQELNSNTAKPRTTLYPNIFNFSDIAQVKRSPGDYFIHVGSLTVLKGSVNLLQLVKKIDKKNKIVIVGKPKDRRSEKIYKELGKFENVTLKGAVDHRQTIEIIANAKALISTSNFEGFPNIFLEAWATGVPVISLKVNPGNVIKKHRLGIYCEGDLEKMKTSIESNATDCIDGNNLTSYVYEYHDFHTAADRFLNLINHS
jgi:glycosyltransferase involved in cell wall biosynthesis